MILPVALSGYRVGLVAQAAAYAMVFLSYTLLTGQGGVISLCQITFAGVGALGTARLAGVDHWPLGLAIIASAVIACAIGVGIGLLTLRMAEFYTALVTLAFGLLMYELVFDLGSFVSACARVIEEQEKKVIALPLRTLEVGGPKERIPFRLLQIGDGLLSALLEG